MALSSLSSTSEQSGVWTEIKLFQITTFHSHPQNSSSILIGGDVSVSSNLQSEKVSPSEVTIGSDSIQMDVSFSSAGRSVRVVQSTSNSPSLISSSSRHETDKAALKAG